MPKKPCFWSLLSFDHYHNNLVSNQKKKHLKGIPNCCKWQIVFKSQEKLPKVLCFKDRILKELTSGVVHKFQCGLCSNSCGECVRHLNVRTGENIGASPLTKKNVRPKGSASIDHMSLCHRLLSV